MWRTVSLKCPVLLGILLIVLGLLVSTNSVSAQQPHFIPYISCGPIEMDWSERTISLPITVDSGTAELDMVRMEMVFDETVLSNPYIEIGTDFDRSFDGELNGLYVVEHARSLRIGPARGRVEFGTVTFDWTGEGTEITFNPGDFSGEQIGSLFYLVGVHQPLDSISCVLADVASLNTSPLNVQVNRVGTVSIGEPSFTLSIAAFVGLALSVCIVVKGATLKPKIAPWDVIQGGRDR